MGARGFAVWNADTGRVEAVYDDVVDAIESDPSAGVDPALEEEGTRENPLPVFEGPDSYVEAPNIALVQSQLPSISPEAFTMSLKEAYQRIKRFIPKREIAPGELETIKQWQNIAALTRKSILGSNLKLSKEAGRSYFAHLRSMGLQSKLKKGEVTESKGLALAPYWSAFVGKSFEPQLSKHTGKPSFCAYSTAACRAGCLVGTGKNAQLEFEGQKPYNGTNYKLKVAKSRMLVNEPDAFGRLLVEAATKWRKNCHERGVVPSVRLNVVSDIPWELVFPELFEFFSDIQWYDYTKVPNREAGSFTHFSNYDLTYSYAGTGTIDRTMEELDRGLRVAVVFLTKKHKMPSDFLGVPVIDGDLHDLRWIDPDGVVVGLAYKPPFVTTRKGKRRVLKGTEDRVSSFVVPVEEIDGELVVVETPRQTRQGDKMLNSFDAPLASDVEVVG